MPKEKPSYRELENQITALEEQNDYLLKYSAKKYADTFSSMDDMFQIIELIYDSDGKPIDYYYREVNQAFQQLVGKTKEQLINKRVIDLFSIVEDSWLENYHGVATTGKTVNFEDYGAELDKYYKIFAWKVAENQVAVIFTDISEKKKVEDELKKSIDELNRIFNLSEYIMVCIASPEGYFQKVSPAFTENLGFSDKEFLAKPFVDFVHPDDKKTTIDKMKPLAKGIPVIRFQNRYRCKDDSYICLEWTARSFIKGGAIYAIAYDVTERSKANKELTFQNKEKAKRAEELSIANKELTFQNEEKAKRAEELSIANKELTFQNEEKSKRAAELVIVNKELDEAQKLAQIGSWLFDHTTQKTEWSNEMFRVWGFDPNNGTPENDSIVKRIHSDDFEFYNNCVAKASSSGTPYNFEFRIYHADGEQKTIKTICQPVLGATGEVVSLTGTNQDITPQKQFEKTLVEHQRLKAIGEMSSSIAHDFNNSLQEMLGNLDVVLLQNNFSGSTLERLNSIGSIITDVAERVTALQHFGDTKHENKSAELLNFNSMIEESMKESRPLWKDGMEKEGLKISVTSNFEDIPEINCNRGELKSVLYNLIKNSVEAMPEGGDIIIQTGINTKGVFATITDTGEGMGEYKWN